MSGGEPVPPSLSGILETALYAEDLDAAERFYGGILGLEKIQRVEGRHVFFRCGDGVLLVFDPKATVKPASSGALPVPPHGARGPGHMCFRASDDEINALVEHFAGERIPIEADFRWPNGARSVYVRDPAGNSVEFAEGWLWDVRADRD